jgi:hypothetical protein
MKNAGLKVLFLVQEQVGDATSTALDQGLSGEDLNGSALVCEFRLIVQIFSFLFEVTCFAVIVVRSHSGIGSVV